MIKIKIAFSTVNYLYNIKLNYKYKYYIFI